MKTKDEIIQQAFELLKCFTDENQSVDMNKVKVLEAELVADYKLWRNEQIQSFLQNIRTYNGDYCYDCTALSCLECPFGDNGNPNVNNPCKLVKVDDILLTATSKEEADTLFLNYITKYNLFPC